VNMALVLATAGILIPAAVACAAGTAPDDEFIRVADDNWTFETSETRQRFVPFGSNLVLTSKEDLDIFGPRYDPKRYDRILAACESLNINLLKVFLPLGNLLPDPQSNAEVRIAPGYLDNLEGFLELCRKRHIRVVVTLAEWGGNGCKWWHEGGQYFGREPWKNDPGPDSISILCEFWKTLAARLKDNPTVFAYTPCAEWTFPNGNLTWFPDTAQHGTLPSEPGIWYWRRWLASKYQTIDALQSAWGTQIASFDDITIVDYTYDYAKRAYKDPERKVLDYQNFREWATLRYLAPQIRAIRAADPNHMVTISNHMRQWDLWEGAATYFMGFTASEQKNLVDYVTHHANYSESDLADGRSVGDIVRDTMIMARFCHAGKPMPVMIEEYSFASSDAKRTAEVQEAIVKGTVGHASGWTTWYLQYPSSPNDADAADKSCSSAWLDNNLKPTPWGTCASALGSELRSARHARLPASRTIKLERAVELAPKRLGEVLKASRESKDIVDFSITHEPDLDTQLPSPLPGEGPGVRLAPLSSQERGRG